MIAYFSSEGELSNNMDDTCSDDYRSGSIVYFRCLTPILVGFEPVGAPNGECQPHKHFQSSLVSIGITTNAYNNRPKWREGSSGDYRSGPIVYFRCLTPILVGFEPIRAPNGECQPYKHFQSSLLSIWNTPSAYNNRPKCREVGRSDYWSSKPQYSLSRSDFSDLVGLVEVLDGECRP